MMAGEHQTRKGEIFQTNFLSGISLGLFKLLTQSLNPLNTLDTRSIKRLSTFPHRLATNYAAFQWGDARRVYTMHVGVYSRNELR